MVILSPLIVLWKKILRPITVVLYKVYIVSAQRTKTFFHAQHKLLALLTHRSTVHVVMALLAGAVITVNITQAREVRAEEFAQGSLVSHIFRPEEEIVITAGTPMPTRVSYIDTSASVKLSARNANTIGGGSDLAVYENAAALVKSNFLSGSPQNPNAVERYTVQPGDTISTIAKDFGVTTQTILWLNNMNDTALIKPGQEVLAIRTTGVTYTIQSGDTVDKIAQKYQASVDDIVRQNNLLTAADITAGQEIIIPGGIRPEPPKPVAVPGTQFASVRSSTLSSSSSVAPASAPVSGGSLQWPTTTRRISQYYGYRHTGIDVDGNFGDPIYAAESGTVVQAGWNGGYGLSVVISHGNGLQTRYGHLQKLFVSSGQSVSRGQSLGEEGSTGRSTGSHLHFETIVNGRFVNPFNYY